GHAPRGLRHFSQGAACGAATKDARASPERPTKPESTGHGNAPRGLRHFSQGAACGAATKDARASPERPTKPESTGRGNAPSGLRHFSELLRVGEGAELLEALVLDLPDPLT